MQHPLLAAPPASAPRCLLPTSVAESSGVVSITIMKILVALLLLASIGANIWQLQHAMEVEEILALQKGTIAKQKRAFDLANKELTMEKQSSSRTVKSAQGLLDRTEKLMHESDRLTAENAAYKQRLDALEASKAEAAAVALVTPTPTPLPTQPPTPTPTPTPAQNNAKKKR